MDRQTRQLFTGASSSMLAMIVHCHGVYRYIITNITLSRVSIRQFHCFTYHDVVVSHVMYDSVTLRDLRRPDSHMGVILALPGRH